GARRVVPDLLFVIATRGETQVDVGVATGDDAVLGLAVEAHRRRTHAEARDDLRGLIVFAVPGFDGFAHAQRRGVVDGADREATRRGRRTTERASEGPFAADRPEQHAESAFAVVEVRATERGEDDLPTFEQAERDGVL